MSLDEVHDLRAKIEDVDRRLIRIEERQVTLYKMIETALASLTGAIVAVLSFIQANPAMKSLLSEATYNWTMFIIGCVVVFFGFLNSHTPPQPPKEAP